MPPRTEASLLGLPAELRDQIWEYAAANGAWLDLTPCCKQIYKEMSEHVEFPDDVTSLERVVFKIDSSYIRGAWMEVQCVWRDGKKVRALQRPIQHMQDLFLKRVSSCKPVRHIDIRLIAPADGHFFGAFLMMLTKAMDLSHTLHHKTRWRVFSFPDGYSPPLLLDSDNPEESDDGLSPGPLDSDEDEEEHKVYWATSALHLIFETKAQKADQAPGPSFWECRFEHELLDNLREFALKDRGKPSYCYEYFLAIDWDGSPFKRFAAAAPSTIVLPPSIRGASSVLMDESSISTIKDLSTEQQMNERLRIWESRRDTAAYDMAEWISFRYLNVRPSRQGRYGPKSDAWRLRAVDRMFHFAVCDVEILTKNLFACIDHHAGPAGGPLDMLRLHRFKIARLRITDGTRLGEIYRRSEWYRGTGRWERAQLDLNMAFLELFNPLAPKEIRLLRYECKHLAAIPWPMEMPLKDLSSDDISEIGRHRTGHCPSRLWIESYPNGIRYGKMHTEHSSSESHSDTESFWLATWRNKWEILKRESPSEYPNERRGAIERKHAPDTAWVGRRWECLMCCHDAATTWLATTASHGHIRHIDEADKENDKNNIDDTNTTDTVCYTTRRVSEGGDPVLLGHISYMPKPHIGVHYRGPGVSAGRLVYTWEYGDWHTIKDGFVHGPEVHAIPAKGWRVERSVP